MSEVYPPNTPASLAPVRRDTNWKGVVGLGLAGLGSPIFAIIFGHVMMADIRKGASTSRPLARANLWVGYVLSGLVMAILTVIAVSFFSHGIQDKGGEGACVYKPGYEWAC